MAEAAGKMLELLDIVELSNLYQTSIRKMQPAVLVRRLESEKVSTRGHMPELRARLLRLEARKSHPQLEVPWYPEDEIPKQVIADDKTEKSEISDNAKISAESNAIEMAHKKSMQSSEQRQMKTSENKSLEQKEIKNTTETSNVKPRRAPHFYDMGLNVTLPTLPSIHSDAGNFGLQNVAIHNQTEAMYKMLKLKIQKEKFEGKHTNVHSDCNQDHPHSNQKPLFVTGINLATPQQLEEASGPYESIFLSSNESDITNNIWMRRETYEKVGERRDNEEHDEDPFEHVDSSDWMDDYIE